MSAKKTSMALLATGDGRTLSSKEIILSRSMKCITCGYRRKPPTRVSDQMQLFDLQ